MLYLLFPPKQWESFSSIDPMPACCRRFFFSYLCNHLVSWSLLLSPCYRTMPPSLSHSHIPRHVKDPGVSTSTWVVHEWQKYIDENWIMFDNTLTFESYQSALHFPTLLCGTRRSVVSAGEVGVAEEGKDKGEKSEEIFSPGVQFG